MSEVIEENGRFRGWEVDLIHPCIFATRLSRNEPGIVQELAMFDECVEMESLRHPLERQLTVDMRFLLFLRRTFVVPEIVEAIPFKDGWMRQPGEIREGVAVDAEFTAIPHTVPDGVE